MSNELGCLCWDCLTHGNTWARLRAKIIWDYCPPDDVPVFGLIVRRPRWATGAPSLGGGWIWGHPPLLCAYRIGWRFGDPVPHKSGRVFIPLRHRSGAFWLCRPDPASGRKPCQCEECYWLRIRAQQEPFLYARLLLTAPQREQPPPAAPLV